MVNTNKILAEKMKEKFPQAIIAFLESIDFEDAIRNAVSCSLLKNIFLETLIKN